MRILLVEDQVTLREVTRQFLHDRGFAVDAVERGAEALAAVADTDYDAVNIDLGLPDIDGMKLVSHVQSRAQKPATLIVTARDALESRVEGLNRGADDYILKPFELVELEARLRSVLRRRNAASDVGHTCGHLMFTPADQQASVAGMPVALTRGEAALLEELLRAAGRTLVRDSLEDRLYGFDDTVSRNALEALVSRLRKKLAASGASVEIETKRGIGYRLRPIAET